MDATEPVVTSSHRTQLVRTWLARSWLVAVAVVSLANLTSYVGAAVKDVAVAYYFGRSDGLDAFLISLTLFTFLLNTIGGSVAAAALPVFIRERQRNGLEAGLRVLRSVTFIACASLLAIGLLVAWFAPVFLALEGNFGEEKAEVTRLVLFLLVPALGLGGLTFMWGPALNANGRYAVPAFTPVFAPLATVVVLLLGGASLGPQVLVVGIVFGAATEVCVLAAYMRGLGLAFGPQWTGITSETLNVLRHAGPLIVAGCVSAGATVVDQATAASLGSGAVSALSFGSKVVSVMLGLASVSITSILFPQFAKLSAPEDHEKLRRTFIQCLAIAVGASTIGCVLIVVLAGPIVAILFQRGAFTADDTNIVSTVQVLFALQLPFHVGGVVAVRLLSALHRNQTLLKISAVTLVIDIAANYLFMQLLGVAGIALSTSLVFVASFAMLLVVVVRTLRRYEAT